MCNSFAPGINRPGVLIFLLISLAVHQLRGADAEPFQMELLSSAFGRFHLEDPERESWSLVERGASLGYRGMSWSAQRLRFHTRKLVVAEQPLVDSLEATSGDNLSVSIDTRSYQAKGFPLRGLLKAGALKLNLARHDERWLYYTCELTALKECSGTLFRDGRWQAFSCWAHRLAAQVRCAKLSGGQIGEPLLESLLLSGSVVCGFDDVAVSSYLRFKAESVELQFDASGTALRAASITGTKEATASMQHYANNQCRSYAARSMQLVFGTGATLQKFTSSSDLTLTNTKWSGVIQACAAPSAD